MGPRDGWPVFGRQGLCGRRTGEKEMRQRLLTAHRHNPTLSRASHTPLCGHWSFKPASEMTYIVSSGALNSTHALVF